MPELSVDRMVGQSPPELWPEFSEVERLADHLGQFGEISISRLEPEHMVAWEGEHACGTVELEAAEEGTRVIMRAEVRHAELTVHRVIPDLDAWDRSAAAIEHQAAMQTPAAQRAAERAAERAERERKRTGRRRFRGRRPEHEEVGIAPGVPLPPVPPEPLEPLSAGAVPAGAPLVAEDRALSVLETALERLGTAAPDHSPPRP